MVALTLVVFAQAPAADSYDLSLKDYVPVKDKTQFKNALKKGKQSKTKPIKWKDKDGKETPVSALSTSETIVSESAQNSGLNTIGVHVSYQVSFNTSPDLKALVDTLE